MTGDGQSRPSAGAATDHGPDPSREDLERQFPRWHTWQGISGLWYASRRLTSPPAVVRGEDLTDLRDEIRRWVGNH